MADQQTIGSRDDDVSFFSGPPTDHQSPPADPSIAAQPARRELACRVPQWYFERHVSLILLTLPTIAAAPVSAGLSARIP